MYIFDNGTSKLQNKIKIRPMREKFRNSQNKTQHTNYKIEVIKIHEK